jgi:hypothetical protein
VSEQAQNLLRPLDDHLAHSERARAAVVVIVLTELSRLHEPGAVVVSVNVSTLELSNVVVDLGAEDRVEGLVFVS